MEALIIISSLGVLALISDIFRLKKVMMPVTLLGLALAFVFNLVGSQGFGAFFNGLSQGHLVFENWNEPSSYFNGMMIYDRFAVGFNQIIITIGFLWFLLAHKFMGDHNHTSDYFAVTLFALAGAVVMTSYNHLVMLFLGIEILSISMYVMAGSNKLDLRSNEASMKYFLMGAFATGFLLFGITLIYGASGTFEIEKLRRYIIAPTNGMTGMFNVGVLMMMIGLVFKISAFPFHFWAPDVYDGAPTPITAFMATIVKVAAVAGFFRLFYISFSTIQGIWIPALWVISALTILVGNITALYQKDLKRMLAYSSISHAGYILFAVLAMNNKSAPSLMYYSLAYSFSTLAAFTILLNVAEKRGNTQIDSLRGLARNHPGMGFVMTVAMFSLAGIPPLAGFIAKYYLFAAALQSHFVSLVLLALIGSLVGVYYYFRVVVVLYQDTPDAENPYKLSFAHQALLVICLLATVGLGIFPNVLIGLW